MTEKNLRSFFDGLPGMHGLAEAALSGWHGAVWPLARGAMLTVGDFLICGGDPGTEGRRMLAKAMASQPRTWLIYAPEQWKATLKVTALFHPAERQGFAVLTPDAPERAWENLVRLPKGYTVRRMERWDAEECLTEEWSRDFVREHGTVEKFLDRGIGVLARDPSGRPAAGASAYVSWPGGIEVQLQTRQDLQGQGLATAVAAELICQARKRHLAVAWDAANDASAHIACKLGFVPGKCYTAWERIC